MNVLFGTILLAGILAAVVALVIFLIDKHLVKKENKKTGYFLYFSLFVILIGVCVTGGLTITSSVYVDGTSMSPALNDGDFINMSSSVTVLGKTILREEDNFDVGDIVVFQTNGFMGYDSLDAINDIEEDSENLNNNIIKGYNFSNSKIKNSYYVKRVQYVADVNNDGIDDYYVRGDNRTDENSSIDSKNLGFVDGRNVLGVVQQDYNNMLFVLIAAFLISAFVSGEVVTRYLIKKF